MTKNTSGNDERTEISPVFLDFSRTVEHKEFLFLEGEPLQAKEVYLDA